MQVRFLGQEDSPGGGLQYSCLENPMGGGAWWATRAPVFLPGESHGWRSLVGYSPQGCKELETTEVTEHAHMYKDVTS